MTLCIQGGTFRLLFQRTVRSQDETLRRPSYRISRPGRTADDTMFKWLARALLYVAGVVTGWFIAQDAPSFGVTQMAVALLLLPLFLAIVAFWPAQWRRRRIKQQERQGPGVAS
jgi:hypothetical protein